MTINEAMKCYPSGKYINCGDCVINQNSKCIEYCPPNPRGFNDCWCAICNYIEDGEIVKLEKDTNVESTHDPVNHPSHYTTGMECIEEIITVFGKEVAAHFCLGNVWKYRKRALHKNGLEDLDKSDWYMNKYCELMTELAGGHHGN